MMQIFNLCTLTHTRHFTALLPGTPGRADALTKERLTGTTTEFL